MKIREYSKSDRSQCIELFKSNMPLYFADHELTDFENWLDDMDKRKKSYEGSQAEFYYVLEDDSSVKACGGFYVSRDAAEARMCWGLVDNKSHKNGFGTNLLVYRIEKIRTLYPGTQIALDTSQHTFRFFEKLGFIVTKITENSYAPGLHRYDMVLK